jgi:signal transduction histidine kinase
MAIHVCLEHLAGPLTDKQQELLHAGREECERLQAMINDLLDIARIQAGRMEMRKHRIDLRPVLDVVIEQHRLLVEEKGLAISRQVPPECEFTYADPDRLELILANLFNNAIRHTPPGGSIELRARMTEAGVRFEVADTGEGIPAQYQDQVFEKFFRVPGRAGGASGLGLSMAKNVVEACGGRIGVESVEGQGSTFWFVLPQAPPEATPNGPKS